MVQGVLFFSFLSLEDIQRYNQTQPQKAKGALKVHNRRESGQSIKAAQHSIVAAHTLNSQFSTY